MPCEEVDKLEGTDFFPSKTRSINYRWHSNIAVCACGDTSYFRLRGDKVFLSIFSQYHQSFTKKLTVVLEILNFFVQEGEEGVQSPSAPPPLPPFMGKGKG